MNDFQFSQSVEAERCLIGCLMINPAQIDFAVSRGLSSVIFLRDEHKKIFSAITKIQAVGGKIDLITVYESLSLSGQSNDVGGLPYLDSVVNSVPSAANLREYLRIVVDYYKRRELTGALLAIVEDVGTDAPLNDVIAKAEGVLSGLNTKGKVNTPIMVSAAIKMAFDEMDAKTMGTYKPLFLGIESLDEKLGGVERGDLIVLGARPSHGKTAISLEIALKMAQEYGVAMLQLEMSNKSLGFRIKSRLSGVSMRLLKDPMKLTEDDFDKITAVYPKTDRLNLWLHDQPALAIEQITSYARQIKKSETGLDVLILDHIHLTSDLSGQKLRRDQELARVSGGLKRLAKEMDCIVICLAQLNKGLEGRPKLKDLRECGAIEQDADIVLLNYYPYKDNENEQEKGLFDLDVAKCRNGETGRITLTFDGATQKVGSWKGGYDFHQESKNKPKNRHSSF